MIKVYCASRLQHRPIWLERKPALLERGINLFPTWLTLPDAVPDKAQLWLTCISEVKAADAFLLYLEPEDTLRGAIVEYGAALASGIPCFIVGVDLNARVRSFWFHPLTQLHPTLDKALEAISRIPTRNFTGPEFHTPTP